MKRVHRILLLSVFIGLLLLFASATALTNTPAAGPTGFPLAFKVANPPTCGAINPLNGCGFSYDIISLCLDYTLWLLVSIGLLSTIQLVWSTLATNTRRIMNAASKGSESSQ